MAEQIPSKEATSFTEAELREIHSKNPETIQQIKSVYIQQIDFSERELEKVDRIFSDFTTRTGVLITGAGLLSFLPALGIEDTTYREYLSHFLTWTFPLLLAALVTYYPSSIRINSILKARSFFPDNTVEQLLILKNQTIYLKFLHSRYVERYNRVLWWDKITKALIYAYIASISLNFYTFIFLGKPALDESIVGFLLSVIFGAATIFYSYIKSYKNLFIGEQTNGKS